MDPYLLALRLIHILGGAFWLGAAVVFFFFLEPTASRIGPSGREFMAHLTARRRLPVVIAIASLLNIVAGLLLYWRMSGGLESSWVTSGPGIGYTIGGAAAIASWLIGFLVSRPTIDRMAGIAQRGGAGGEQVGMEVISMLTRRLKLAGGFGLALVVLAASAMAVARYL